MTNQMPEYTATRAQWIKLIQELSTCRDDTVQDELFKDARSYSSTCNGRSGSEE